MGKGVGSAPPAPLAPAAFRPAVASSGRYSRPRDDGILFPALAFAYTVGWLSPNHANEAQPSGAASNDSYSSDSYNSDSSSSDSGSSSSSGSE
jgi:hypothetical protein